MLKRISRGCALGAALCMLASLLFVEESKAGPRTDKNTGGMCIPPAAAQTLTDCAGLSGANVSAVPSMPRSRLRTAKRKVEEKTARKYGPSIELDAATRRNREKVQSRAWNLLQREVTVLGRLVSNTSKSDARRPEILLRLAETYFEMQQQLTARVRSYDEPIFQARKQKNTGKVRDLENKQKQAEKELQKIREESVRTYAILVQDHSDFKRMDEVLFSLAFGLEEMKQFERARQVYHRLIKNYPDSRFVPHAYLSFAEFYFAEGDMQASLQFYDKVVGFPPEKNPVYGYALYKQAWAYYNLDNFKGALQKFVEVIEFATQHPEAKDAENLAKQSRRELVLPYAQVGSASKALEFFARYAKNREQSLDMLENLGELYYDTGQWPNTIAVYHKLMSESPASDKMCYWQSRVSNAVISSKPKAEQVKEVQRLVDVFDTFEKQNHSAESKVQCKQAAASVVVELATAWHREAVGTENHPGTNDKNTMRMASQIYRLAVEKFPDMDQMEFPDIDKRDWPTRYKIAYYNAELLWKMENWGECGPAFDRVVELNPKGEYTSDAAYAAVLCYNNLYQQQYQGRERQSRGDEAEEKSAKSKGKKGKADKEEAEDTSAQFVERPFTHLEKGMLNAFSRYVCYVKDGKDLPTIKYRRARIYYEANHFEEAAVHFKDIAYNHKNSELAEYAANLYLDCLNVLGSLRKPPRSVCLDEMGDAVQEFSQLYCSAPGAAEKYTDLCPTIASLECGILRKKAEAHQTNREFKQAASTYVRIFRAYNKNAGQCSGRMDEVLYNAALNFEAGRLLGRAIKVRTVLIAQFPDSHLAKRSVFLVGANYHALAIYSKAADYYEEFAKKFPGEDGKECTDAERKAGTCAVASEALQNAVFFRLGLGEEDKAVDDANLYARNYRKRLPQETAQVIFSLGTIYKQRKDWTKVKDHYGDFLAQYKRQALPNQIIRAYVEMGRAHWEVRDRPKAQGYFESAVKEWNANQNRFAKLSVDDSKKELYLFEAKDAASEAMFHLAELKFSEFQKIKFPEYKEGRNLDAINRWAKKKFGKWVQDKQKALQAAEASYNRIAPLEVPEWMIASAARIGEMYASFIDAFREAPVPAEIENDEELYGIYVDELERQAKAFEKPAVDKFEFCVVRATQVRWFNNWSQTCERELNRLNPVDYPLAAELRGAPGYAQNVVARPDPVELPTGEDEDVGGADGS